MHDMMLKPRIPRTFITRLAYWKVLKAPDREILGVRIISLAVYWQVTRTGAGGY